MRYLIATIVDVDPGFDLKPEDIRARIEALNRGEGMYIHTDKSVMTIRKMPKEDE